MQKQRGKPRILFITPEIACIPDSMGAMSKYDVPRSWGATGILNGMIGRLYSLGANISVAQPNYRRIFKLLSKNKQISISQKLPSDRVYLTEDRIFYYSKRLDLNSELENIKFSIVFQREVANTVIPMVQPDLIHCHDWMTGLIPAVAREFNIPCLYSVYKFGSAKASLRHIEDMGFDAATFWQNFYYQHYPFSYAETRETNPLDFLLSGIFSANFVNIMNSKPLGLTIENGADTQRGPLKKLLTGKHDSQCLALMRRSGTRQYIDLYEQILHCDVIKEDRQRKKSTKIRKNCRNGYVVSVHKSSILEKRRSKVSVPRLPYMGSVNLLSPDNEHLPKTADFGHTAHAGTKSG